MSTTLDSTNYLNSPNRGHQNYVHSIPNELVQEPEGCIQDMISRPKSDSYCIYKIINDAFRYMKWFLVNKANFVKGERAPKMSHPGINYAEQVYSLLNLIVFYTNVSNLSLDVIGYFEELLKEIDDYKIPKRKRFGDLVFDPDSATEFCDLIDKLVDDYFESTYSSSCVYKSKVLYNELDVKTINTFNTFITGILNLRTLAGFSPDYKVNNIWNSIIMPAIDEDIVIGMFYEMYCME